MRFRLIQIGKDFYLKYLDLPRQPEYHTRIWSAILAKLGEGARVYTYQTIYIGRK